MKRLHKAIFGASNHAALVKSLGPAAWFRAGTGITVTGSGVSQWDDQSGNARHLKQGTDANRPALQADNSILFNGTSHYLKCDAFTLNQPETVYILFKQVSWAANDSFCDGNTNATLNIYQQTATPTIGLFAGGAACANGALALGAYGAVCGVFNGASSVLRANSTSSSTGNPGAGNAGGFTLGSNATPAGHSNIQVREVIIFPTAHSTAQQDRVIRGLSRIGQLGI